MAHNEPWILNWLNHQRRDDYWKHGSVCEDYAKIEAPTLVVGGWNDAYSNAVPRLMKGMRTTRKAIIGPWAHKYPHFAVPEPRIGFLQEALRWWDRWLKDIDTGIMAEPMLRAGVGKASPSVLAPVVGKVQFSVGETAQSSFNPCPVGSFFRPAQ
mgnify:CR=1 FL=1